MKRHRLTDPQPQLAREMVSGASIGNRIGARLEQLGWGASDLARALGIERLATAHEWVADKYEPSAVYLRQLPGVLEMTLEELLGIAEGQEPPFDSWKEFVSQLGEKGDTLSRLESRALRSFAWPTDQEPTVAGYFMLLGVVRQGTKKRVVKGKLPPPGGRRRRRPAIATHPPDAHQK